MYDSRVRPNDGAEPVQVTANFFIASFDSISESNMDYTMNVYLRLESMVYKMVMPTAQGRGTVELCHLRKIQHLKILRLLLIEAYLLTI